ncbi:hypothetical protein D3C78_1690890 [compost metagenome]
MGARFFFAGAAFLVEGFLVTAVFFGVSFVALAAGFSCAGVAATTPPMWKALNRPIKTQAAGTMAFIDTTALTTGTPMLA